MEGMKNFGANEESALYFTNGDEDRSGSCALTRAREGINLGCIFFSITCTRACVYGAVYFLSRGRDDALFNNARAPRRTRGTMPREGYLIGSLISSGVSMASPRASFILCAMIIAHDAGLRS